MSDEPVKPDAVETALDKPAASQVGGSQATRRPRDVEVAIRKVDGGYVVQSDDGWAVDSSFWALYDRLRKLFGEE